MRQGEWRDDELSSSSLPRSAGVGFLSEAVHAYLGRDHCNRFIRRVNKRNEESRTLKAPPVVPIKTRRNQALLIIENLHIIRICNGHGSCRGDMPSDEVAVVDDHRVHPFIIQSTMA